MLKAIYAGSGLKVFGEFVPSTSPYILCIPNFDLRDGNFKFLLQERVATPYWVENVIKLVRPLTIVKFKYLKNNEL